MCTDASFHENKTATAWNYFFPSSAKAKNEWSFATIFQNAFMPWHLSTGVPYLIFRIVVPIGFLNKNSVRISFSISNTATFLFNRWFLIDGLNYPLATCRLPVQWNKKVHHHNHKSPLLYKKFICAIIYPLMSPMYSPRVVRNSPELLHCV